MAGQQYDPCYHLACDTYTNVSETVLGQMAGAAAHAIVYFPERETGPGIGGRALDAGVARDRFEFWGPQRQK